MAIKKTLPLKKNQKTPQKVRDLEELVSVAALLRPYLEKGVQALSKSQLIEFEAWVTSAEKVLANSSLPYPTRFQTVSDSFQQIYPMGPIWRFVDAKIREIWQGESGLREFHAVSLIFGILYEAVLRKTKNRASF